MPSTNEDRSILKRNKRRLQLIAIPFVAVFVTLWWLGSTWLEHGLGLSQRVAQAAVFLLLSVVSLPVEQVLRFRAAVNPRHRALFNNWQSQRQGRFRVLLILYLVFNLVITLSALRHPHRGVAFDDPFNLTVVMLLCLAPWRSNLFFVRSVGPVDELLELELMRSAVRGFATLALLSLAAAIGNDARPGTLHVTLPAALLLSALVAQLSLWIQDRRAGRDADDR